MVLGARQKEGLDAHQKHSINNKIGLPGRCSQRAVDLSSCLFLLNKKVFTNVAKGLESCEERKSVNIGGR